MKTRIGLAVVALFALGLAACGVVGGRRSTPPKPPAHTNMPPAPPPAALPPLPGAVKGVDLGNFPRLASSTSAWPLVELIAARAVGLPGELRRIGARSVHLAFPTDTPPEHVEAFLRFMGESGRLHQAGTHGAYMMLAAGAADIILVARGPSADERKAASERNMDFDVRPLALDGLVFLVSRRNPVESLTLEQVRDIYTGRTTDWARLGGPQEPIAAFGRDPNSGSQELMDQLVMKGEAPIKVPNDMLLFSMTGPIDEVARRPNAIAYSVYYYERYMNRNMSNRLLAIEGVAPDADSIRSRRYPLAAEVQVVLRRDAPADGPAARLRDWLLNEEGQRLVASSGYVPILGAAPGRLDRRLTSSERLRRHRERRSV